MLAVHPSSADLSSATWIDLLNPSEEERAQVENATGLRLPKKAEIEEIELSSRTYLEAGSYYLSTPLLEGTNCLHDALTTVGFVLAPQHLVTLRFTRIAPFDKFAAGYARVAPASPRDALLHILESVVDHAADALEHASAELERISRSAFHSDRPRGVRWAHASEQLHAALRELGRMDDGLSHIRDALLGFGRITGFLLEANGHPRSPDVIATLQVVRGDISSLNDYQAHLSHKVQFLLEATLGFISIQQNDIVKTLTIASVVGVPPVVIAGIYGMNFKVMPELHWPFGYFYALAFIVASAVLPFLWFKWRGWM